MFLFDIFSPACIYIYFFLRWLLCLLQVADDGLVEYGLLKQFLKWYVISGFIHLMYMGILIYRECVA